MRTSKFFVTCLIVLSTARLFAAEVPDARKEELRISGEALFGALRIDYVKRGSEYARMGLKAGDHLLAACGEKPKSAREALSLIERAVVGGCEGVEVARKLRFVPKKSAGPAKKKEAEKK
ncbi:hypothetical protein FDZ71_05855 [bacterium]|nr:MAG: hypothetical protein FDZ71_05855 [bacterium]